MSLITNDNSIILWRDAIKDAENNCSVTLGAELVSYLTSLLVHYTDKPEIAKAIVSSALLEAMQQEGRQRLIILQNVGDQCLLYSGLFPHIAERRLVKISYFVELGRSAYAAISYTANDLFSLLAKQFVIIMDVLQSMRYNAELLPLEAYEQWNELGSQRARKALEVYSQVIALRNKSRRE
jgi:hypothetical protein